MHTGVILVTFVSICIGMSVILALLFRFWPQYGSVSAAIERSDHLLEQMETTPSQKTMIGGRIMAQQYDPYEVHTSLWEDLGQGWVWVYPQDTEKQTQLRNRRRIVRIRRKNCKESVYCEALLVDPFYVKHFNVQALHPISLGKDNLIFISAWYRRMLDEMPLVTTQSLSISVGESLCQCLLWLSVAALQHPQVGVFLTTVLAILGLGFGVLGLGFGIISVKDLLQPQSTIRSVVIDVGWVFVAVGLLVAVLSVVPLFRRARASSN